LMPRFLFVGIASRNRQQNRCETHLWRYVFVAIAYFNTTCFVACALPWQ
jgi:hypothetical protein